ncbi:restriction endonuclease subunit S [Flavobacteriaceae bacterium]|nr:restriction endonuclease subunit S [Flavobacteriaceae bacterium]
MQLLQHFKELTVRPKNAQELKGLILQLAIQGKLTGAWRKENPDVESASELLKKIKKERVQLIKEKKVRKGKPIQPIKKEEKYLEIPQNWVWTRIIEAGNIFNGNSVNKSIKAAKYEGLEEGLPYLGTKDINYGFETLNYENGVKIPFDEPKFKIAHRNTALICSEGGSAGKKCGITTEDICFGNKLYAFEQYGDIKSVYILSIYKTPIFFEVFQSKMTGIIGGVSINSFGEIPIPLPPREEQEEIVKVVETLFKEVEQLEQLTVERIDLKENFVTSALNQLTTNNANQEWSFLQDHFKNFFNETRNIKKLRETVLQLAVQGKLTADWRENNPDTEPVSKSIEEAFKNQKVITTGRKKFLRPVDKVIFNDLKIPLNWVKTQFFNLCVLKRGHDLPKQDRVVGKYPVASSGGISGWHNEYKSERGVVIGRSGSTGKPHLIDNKHWPLNTVLYGEDYCGNYIDYVFVFLKAFDFSQYSSSTAVPTLNRNKFLNDLILIPPLEEQKAIVQKVNALMGLCDTLEQEVKQSQEQIAQLMQSCLREVFEGEK